MKTIKIIFLVLVGIAAQGVLARVMGEEGEFYQGDIVIIPEQVHLLLNQTNIIEEGKRTQNGVFAEKYSWPKTTRSSSQYALVYVPYVHDVTSRDKSIFDAKKSE